MDNDYDSDYSILTHTRKSAGDLETFFKNHTFETPKKCPYTNIVDQRLGKTYCIPFPLQANKTHDPNKFKSGKKANPQAVTYFGSYGDQSNLIRPGGTFMDPPMNSVTPIEEFFMRMEACRLDGIPMNFSERQYFTINRTVSTEIKQSSLPQVTSDDPNDDQFYIPDTVESDTIPEDPIALMVQDQTMDIEVSKSCIEYDFDIYLREARDMRNNLFSGILAVFTNVAIDVIDWEDPVVLENPLDPKSGVLVTFYAAIMRKPQRRIADASEPAFKKYGECWKESFHIRIFIKVTKPVKLFIRKKMLADNGFQSLFHGLGMINTLDEAFDRSIISNPIMFLGSCKKGGNRPHELETLYHVECRPTLSAPIILTHDDFKPTVQDSSPYYDGAGRKRGMAPTRVFCKYNLCYELSLNYEVPEGLVRKHEYEPKKKYKPEIMGYADRVETDIADVDVTTAEQEVQSITVQNYAAEYDKAILDIVGRHRAINYEDWKTVILALCRKNQNDYKALAKYFSLRYAQSFLKDGMTQIDGLWNWAIGNGAGADKKTSMATIYYWAKQDNPEEYRNLQDRNVLMKMTKILTDQQGAINNTQFAKILHEMFSHKFRCDVNPMALGRDNYIWREFVTEKDDAEAGELYKWRKQMRLTTLENYVATVMPEFLKKVMAFYKSRVDRINEEIQDPNSPRIEQKKGEKKYLELINAKVLKLRIKLGDTSLINPIIERCKLEFQFGNRGFEKSMDSQDPESDVPIHIGVRNGVLRLRPKLHLIQGYHEIPISKSVNVDFVPYNPNDPYIKELMSVFMEIYDNDVETMDFCLCLLASGLDDLPKTPQYFFIWHGGGAQGKSVINLLDMNTLGLGRPGGEGGYATKMDIGWFCTDRKGSGPDSAISATKKMRRIWCSESDIEATPRTGKIKEITSDPVSANDKNEKQDIWKVNAHIIVPTNHKMRIMGRDYGTWRRMLYYRFKRFFKQLNGFGIDKYDPNNPKHSIARREIIDEWVNDRNYQRAYFSILTHYYEILRDKYGGDIRRVPKSTIDRETEEYFKEQDVLTQFICERVIHVGPTKPADGTEVELIDVSTIMKKFMAWFTTLIGSNQKFNNQELREEITTHYKLEKYFINGIGGQYLTEHCILDMGENSSKLFKQVVPIEQSLSQVGVSNDKKEEPIQDIDNVSIPELPAAEFVFSDEQTPVIEQTSVIEQTPVIEQTIITFDDLEFE